MMDRTQNTEEQEQIDHENQDWSLTLPKEIGMGGNLLYLYQGFWCPQVSLKGMMLFQKHFKPQETDIILASTPKSGTTWLKALTFIIVNRSDYSSLEESPLLTTGPHGLVPFFDFDFCSKKQYQDLEKQPQQPRIFATHFPFSALPSSVKDCGRTKIVYVCRNPLDMFISHWKFSGNIRNDGEEQLPLEVAFDKLCHGIHGYGPFWDHILGYWKASLERADKVLFLKYEDLKKDSVFYIKKLAKFVGFPFSEEEEKQGLVEEISRFCSFESMKDSEATKTGCGPLGIPNTAFFRAGKVGDSLRYLTPSMVEQVEVLVREKLQDFGLSLIMPAEMHNGALS